MIELALRRSRGSWDACGDLCDVDAEERDDLPLLKASSGRRRVNSLPSLPFEQLELIGEDEGEAAFNCAATTSTENCKSGALNSFTSAGGGSLVLEAEEDLVFDLTLE